jgi:hypothetical protein
MWHTIAVMIIICGIIAIGRTLDRWFGGGKINTPESIRKWEDSLSPADRADWEKKLDDMAW